MLIIVLLLSFLSISGVPFAFFEKGILITSVGENSKSFEEGLKEGQIILSVNGEQVLNEEDYSRIINSGFPTNEKVKTIIQTKESEFILFTNSSCESS